MTFSGPLATDAVLWSIVGKNKESLAARSPQPGRGHGDHLPGDGTLRVNYDTG